jgi:peptide deformylase
MSTLDILTFPDPRLRNKAKPVPVVSNEIRRTVDDMFETMYQAPGIGLAAVQVDIPLQIIVIDISEKKDSPLCLINPEILERQGTEEMEEGCLSVPGFYEQVSRAEKIRVRALNREGEVFELETDGLLGVCIQHEVDHLHGKLFVDYLSSLKRQRIRKKLEKERRQHRPQPVDPRRRVI